MKTKITIIIILITLISINLVLGATPINQPVITTPINPQTPVGVTNDQLMNVILQENIKTRTEFTAYTDRKITEMITTVKTDGQAMIDENFRILDQRIQDTATKLVIKITIGIIIAIILGLSIWYSIYHQINKLLKKRPHSLTSDEYALTRAGLITPEYATKIEKESRTQYKMPPSPEYKDAQPKPPSIQQIEKMIIARRKEKEIQQLQKEKEKKIKEYNKKANKIIPEIEKIKEMPEPKNPFINPQLIKNRRQKKIDGLNKQLEPHRLSVEKVIEKENNLDREIKKLNEESQDFQKVIQQPDDDGFLPPLKPQSLKEKDD